MKHIYLILAFILLKTTSFYAQTISEEFLEKGDNFYRQKDYRKAIEQYNKAIEKDAKFIIAYINKGQALEFERRFEEAIENYNALLAIIPNETQCLTRRGISLMKIQKIQEGLLDLEKADKQDPNNAKILCNLGLGKIASKDVSGIKELDQSIKIDSTDYIAFYNRGLGKILLLDFKSAITDFEKTIMLNPYAGEAYFSIGLCKFIQGEKESACNYWKKSFDYGYIRAQPMIDRNCK